MKKTIKIFLYTIGFLVLLVVAAAIAATLLINPNDYKDDIVKVVHDKTGRELQLKGDIKLSLFPWLGLELGQTSFGNAPGFGALPMASIDSIDVKLKLLPLLRKEVEVDTIVLDGLKLNLRRNKVGVSNWDDLVTPTTTGKTPAPSAPSTRQAPAAAPIAALTIGGVDIRHGDLHWLDEQNGTSVRVRNLSLQTSKLAIATPMDIKLGFDLATGKPVIRTPVRLQGQVTVDPNKETLTVKRLQLALLDLNVDASLNGAHVLSTPELSGKVSLRPTNLRGVLSKLGISIDMPADAMKSVSLDSDVHFNQKTNTASVNNLVLQLDDSKLTGNATYIMSKVPAVRADIAVDSIDVDRYLPTTPAGSAETKGKASSGKRTPVAIPIAPLRTLDLKSSFKLGSLKAFGIRSTNISIPIAAKGGLVQVGPSKAKLYGGSYVGRQSLDVRKGAPRISSDEKLTNVEIGGLLKDAGIFDKFTGVGNVSADVTARGIDVDDIMNSLNGKASASLKNGRVKGLNLHKMVADAREAYAKAKGQPVPTRPKVTDEMEYAKLTASATIKNGIVTNTDLIMDGPFTTVTGSGTVNLPKYNLDYRANVRISENKNDDPVPVRIHGPFSNLSYSVEWDKVLKARAQKEVQKRVVSEKKKAQEQLKKQLEDKLKDLFKR